MIAVVVSVGTWHTSLLAQSTLITLEDCGQAYIDPQDANNGNSTQSRDTLVYTHFFAESLQRQAYIVDVNAFGGQQVDRVEVFAILADDSRKRIGQLSLGNCVDCTSGFTLVEDGEPLVEGVDDIGTMEMWIQSTGQPDFALPGNLQTLTGVGRISGTAPFCAIGLEVRYSVFSDPGNASTEFSTYIHCPEPVGDCPISILANLNCNSNQIELNASLPSDCFMEGYTTAWRSESGLVSSSLDTALSIDGNEGWYYFEATDDCCTVQDSFLIDYPEFAEAGPDVKACAGTEQRFSGTGGQGHYWTTPDGSVRNDSILQLDFLQPDDAGAYILYAFDEQGCEDRDTFLLHVNAPPIPEPFIPQVCMGDTVFLQTQNDTAFASIRWLDPLNNVLAGSSLPDFQPPDIGQYTVQGMDSIGCTTEQQVLVSARPLPVVDYEIEDSCDSTFVYFSPTAWTYTWPEGEGDRLATATGGDFVVTATDTVGCQSEQLVPVPAPDGPEVILELEQPICPGELGRLDIVLHSEQRQAIFSLDGGERFTLSDEFKNLQPGDYELLVLDALGCEQRFDFNIQRPDTMGVSLNYEPIVVRPTTPIDLTATTIGNIQRYQWVPREIDTGGPATSFVATQDLDIRLIVEDDRGCRATAALPLTVELGDVYAPTAFSPNGDGRNDYFTIYSDNGSGEIIERMQVYDRWGGLVFEALEVPLSRERFGWGGDRLGEPMNSGYYAFYALVRYPNGYRRIVKGEVHLIR